MYFKSVIYFVVILLTYNGIGADDLNCGHDFAYGQRQTADELLFMDVVEKSWSMFGRKTADIEYPLPHEKKEGYITTINISDKDGNGGCVLIKSGGVGQSSVSLHLESNLFKGMKFVIRIYGHRRYVQH